jgi:hypothetical protein
MQPALDTPPACTQATLSARTRCRWSALDSHALRKPSPAEWTLIAYLFVVSGFTILSHVSGQSVVRTLASNPDDLTTARWWQLITSGLLAQGPLVPQLVALAALGIVAIRLAGGRLFWSAALLAHILGTLVVYAGVWVAAAASPSALATLLRSADFGVSLVWCAALGVLAGVAWWKTRPLPRWAWRLLAVGPAVALLGATFVADGLAPYEHVVAFGMAAGLVYVTHHSLPTATSRVR